MPKTYYIKSPVENIVLTRAYLISTVSTSGSDALNNWEFQVTKNGVTNMTAAPKSTNGAEIAAGTPYDLGAILQAVETVAASDTIEVTVTKNGSPTDLSGSLITFGIDHRVDIA